MPVAYFDSLKVLIHFTCFATRLINKELHVVFQNNDILLNTTRDMEYYHLLPLFQIQMVHKKKIYSRS